MHCSLISLSLHVHSLQLTIHSVEANVTEHYQLFHTVNSHTFHNLSSNTAYSVTITAVNKAGSGPTVSVNVTTQGPDVAGNIQLYTGIIYMT